MTKLAVQTVTLILNPELIIIVVPPFSNLPHKLAVSHTQALLLFNFVRVFSTKLIPPNKIK